MLKKNISILFSGFFLISTFGCNSDAVPKPDGQLRLEYPKPDYVGFENSCPFAFIINDDAIITDKGSCNMTISYPRMKATIYLTYKPVKNDIEAHLKDAQKLTYSHTVKADDITEQPFLNDRNRVYGMFYRVGGNAATNALFYATDSTRHFLTGSVYFYAKPNFDSIMPASDYVKNDMRIIMETLRWK
ncbi:MAG TPA: gliding motility lipoprotein GldD [Flavobacterium sp.]|nr:gliding motility lipoprotein GldD [Flavobacterium sp.]